jgi:hypothetical protein
MQLNFFVAEMLLTDTGQCWNLEKEGRRRGTGFLSTPHKLLTLGLFPWLSSIFTFSSLVRLTDEDVGA